MVNNYDRGKIYKIVCNLTGNIYVGSTTEPSLARRLAGHKSSYNSYLKGKKNYISSIEILKNGNYFIELICNASCNSRDELSAIEGNYIRELNCINKNIAGRSKKEYNKKYREEHAAESKKYRIDNEDKLKEQKKEYYKINCNKIKEKTKKYKEDNADKIKKYKEINAEKIKEQQKIYYNDNLDKLKEQNKIYYQQNAEEIKEQKKIYYQQNADKLKQKINCACGGRHSYEKRARHCKSKKHQKYLNL